jgi:hypothetical protein
VANKTEGNVYSSTLEGYSIDDFEGLRYDNLASGGGGAVGPVLGSAEVVAPDGTVYVFSRDAGSGDLQATYWPPGGQWASADMRAMAGTPVFAGGSPAVVLGRTELVKWSV